MLHLKAVLSSHSAQKQRRAACAQLYSMLMKTNLEPHNHLREVILITHKGYV